MKYFDYAATCPIDEAALSVYNEASRNYFGNTSSLHDIGTKANTLLEYCRDTLAEQLEVDRAGLYFTSGGTESNSIGLHALVDAGKGNHIITSQAEHSSIHNVLEKLEQEGYEITKLPFTEEGIVDMKALENALRSDTTLVSIQLMNAEIGTLQPIEQISSLCKKSDAYFHCDCVQALGKADLKQATNHMDSFSISSHKVYGPKGVGAVYIDPSLSFSPLLPNGSHEKGVRAGTVNIPGVAAFTTAAKESIKHQDEQASHIRELKRTFKTVISPMQDKLEIIGTTEDDCPIIGMCLKGVEGQWSMLEANRRGYAFSTGSACTTSEQTPSKTVLAMGYPEETAKTFIRISFGKYNTKEDAAGLAECLMDVLATRYQTTSGNV